MKTSIKTIAASIALTALMAGPASAMVSRDTLAQNVHSAAGAGSNVFVNLDNNVVTLTGRVESVTDKNAAIRAAKANTGIDRVIDLTSVSR